MAGTREGGIKQRATVLKKYGPDYFKRIGARGGKASNTGGFQKGSLAAKEAGKKGGSTSVRLSKAAARQRDKLAK